VKQKRRVGNVGGGLLPCSQHGPTGQDVDQVGDEQLGHAQGEEASDDLGPFGDGVGGIARSEPFYMRNKHLFLGICEETL